jgi:hypothetical protein
MLIERSFGHRKITALFAYKLLFPGNSLNQVTLLAVQTLTIAHIRPKYSK